MVSAISLTGKTGFAAISEGTSQTLHKSTAPYDIVIIGAGCAGLCAAIEAADQGARVVVLEKMFAPFGNTIYAGGNFIAANSWVQKKSGISDSVDQFYEDLMQISMRRGDPELTRMLAEKSSDTIQWLTNRCHVEWKPISMMRAPTYGRLHEVAGDIRPGGSQLIRKLLDECKRLNVPIVYKTKAIELLQDKDLNCIGVKARGPDGTLEYYAKGGVVVCTGGFHNNKEMVTRYMGGNVAWMPLRGSTVLTGENITLTQPFFPQYVNMDQFHAGPIHPTTRANTSSIVNYGICVNRNGERFIDEGKTYVYIGQNTPKLIKENRAFVVLDSRVLNKNMVSRVINRYKRAKAEIYQANSIPELARQMGLPVLTLEKTIKEFNTAVHNGTVQNLVVPSSHQRPYTIEKPPFFGFMYAGGMTATFGGPKINKKAEVINTEGLPIPGLYAAGNAIGGLFYDNYIGGSQLTAAVIWGRVAAREAFGRSKRAL